MKLKNGILTAVVLSGLMSSAAGAVKWSRPDLVEKVAKGKISDANVSWWGFDKDDSTAYIQAALNSKARKLTLDSRLGTWFSRPLRGRSDLELVVPEGVELCAKRGEFKQGYDWLLTFDNVTNVTLSGGGTIRMWMEDYTNKTLYAWSEWRHALSFRSCHNVLVENLRIADSGGDGIYLGRKGYSASNTDVVIRNVTLTRNNRQGISVITADRLLIENCVMEGTCGTPPMAGIDFEPNSPRDMLRDIVVRNCVARDNHGAGFDFSVCNLDATSPEISILLENCRSEGNYHPMKHHSAYDPITRFRGEVLFRNCLFNDRDKSLKGFRSSEKRTVSFTFENCKAANPENVNELMPLGSEYGWGRLKPPLWPDGSALKMESTRFPSLARVKVLDKSPGKSVRLNPVYLRSRVQYMVYADSARKVRIKCLARQVNRSKFSDFRFTVTSADGKIIKTVILKAQFKKEQEIVFDAPARGFYGLSGMVMGSHAITLLESDAPVAMINSPSIGVPGWSGLPGEGYFIVPEGVERFALSASGGHSGEYVRVRLTDPDGVVVWDEDNVLRSKLWIASEKLKPGVWTLSALKASKGGMDDYGFAFFGEPYTLFLSKEKMWK